MKNIIAIVLIGIALMLGLWLIPADQSNTLGSMGGRDAYNYRSITSEDAGSIIVLSSARAILGSVVVASSTAAGEIIIYDSATSTGISTTTIASSTKTKISRIKGGVSENTLTYDVMAKDGISIGIPSTFGGAYTLTWK